MFLNERERRVLAEIEQRLADSDPALARALRRRLPSRTDRTRAGRDAVAVVAGLTAFLCLMLSLVGSAVVAILVAAAALYLRIEL
jgi:hypothetical protein